MPTCVDLVEKVNVILSLLRCADDALMTGDDCANDIIAVHAVVVGILQDVKQSGL